MPSNAVLGRMPLDLSSVSLQVLPSSPEVFNNYGISLLQRAIGMRDGGDVQQQQLAEPQFESAILALREAAKNAPANGDILVNLACALVESGRAEKALGIMNVHNARTPGSVKGLNTAAVAMFQLGQLTQSVQTLQKISDDSVASQNLALVPLNRPLRRKPSKQVENKGL